jgi:hypothetical protein
MAKKYARQEDYRLCRIPEETTPKPVGYVRVRRYDRTMEPRPASRRRLAQVWRALVEIAFIVFLFYSNLLMGEFTHAAGKGKTLVFALGDIFTATNLTIAFCSAMVGYVTFEFLRKRL